MPTAQAGREDPTASREVKEKLARLVREDDHPQTRTSGLTAEVMAQIRKLGLPAQEVGAGATFPARWLRTSLLGFVA